MKCEDSGRLEQAYRRWMRVYPAWYRRERGLELLTTLLDDAAPGQDSPRRADLAALIGGGLRARVLPPRRLVAWLTNVMITLSVALAFASVAVLASGFPGPPTEEQAIAVATVAIGPPTRNVPGPPLRCPCDFTGNRDQVVPDDEEPMRIDGTTVYYDPPWPQATAMWAQARQRLLAAGWRVLPRPVLDPNDHTYVASSDTLDAFVYPQPFPAGPDGYAPTVALSLTKRVSGATVYGVIASGLAGLIIGWLTGVWVLYRYDRHDQRRRRIIRAAARPFFAIAALILQITAVFVWVDFSDGIGGGDIEAPMAFTGIGGPGTGLSAICVLLGLTAMVLTALPGDTTTDGSRDHAHQAPA